MKIFRRILSVVLGLGLLALWGGAHWQSLALTTFVILLVWGLFGVGAFGVDLSFASSWPDRARSERKRLSQPWIYGPLVWLFYLFIKPWLKD